jgi:hypothetical protein
VLQQLTDALVAMERDALAAHRARNADEEDPQPPGPASPAHTAKGKSAEPLSPLAKPPEPTSPAHTARSGAESLASASASAKKGDKGKGKGKGKKGGPADGPGGSDGGEKKEEHPVEFLYLATMKLGLVRSKRQDDLEKAEKKLQSLEAEGKGDSSTAKDLKKNIDTSLLKKYDGMNHEAKSVVWAWACPRVVL